MRAPSRRIRALLAAGCLALPLSGCPKQDDAEGDTPTVGATPAKARKAFRDFITHAAAMLQRTCEGNYTTDELEAELERQFEEKFGGGCEAADGLRDESSFYVECLPGLDAMEECLAERLAAMPAACNDQLQFFEE